MEFGTEPLSPEQSKFFKTVYVNSDRVLGR